MDETKPQNLEAENDGVEYEEESPRPKDSLFFNVMPRTEVVSKIIEPTLKLAPSENNLEPKVDSAVVAMLKKYKLYVILAAVVLIGGPAVYFGINSFAGTPEEENFLVADTTANNPEPTPSEQELLLKWNFDYFGEEICSNQSLCGEEADPDLDGLLNKEEFKQETDPNNKDSDQDGLADGDEINVFGSNPLNAHTAGDEQYSDSDFLKGGYDLNQPSDKKMSQDQIDALSAKMNELGLHQPTLSTLENVLNSFYKFGTKTATTTPETIKKTEINADMSLEAKQDRDAQRSATIKNLGIALVKYFDDHDAYPNTKNFRDMHSEVKVYIKVALNPTDPINVDPYVYSYEPINNGTDFTLSFYSEVAAQVIKKHAKEANEDRTKEEASIYDDQRKNHIQSLQTALLLYSSDNVDGTQDYVFPTQDKYKTALVPKFLTAIPKDPKTNLDYEYKVSEGFNTFTIKAVLDAPSPGTTGFMCNQEECRDY